MKTIMKTVILVIILALVLPMEAGQLDAEPVIKEDFRGIWVATVLNIDYPKNPTTNPDILKEEAAKMLDNVKILGINAVFLQVRPSGDALYNSNLYPWSKYLTGEQGQAPDDGFDSLEFWIDEAHKRGIELHAWINPYRITKKAFSEPKHDFGSLDPTNPAVINPDWVVKHSDGNLYLNPGLPQTRKYIIDGVIEIIENYDVDGIHMDDYFYPGKNFDDIKTYNKYGVDFDNIDDWRRENVNILIRQLHEVIKPYNIRFGVSPFGIWANNSSNPLGSDTKGAQSYYEHYADTRKWVKEGIIDYLAPQIYWNIGFNVADYEKLALWWADVVKGTGVDLYIGQAAYKVQVTDAKNPWYGEGEIERQFNLNSQIPEVKGSILYNYSSVAKNPELFSMIQIYNDKKNEQNESIPIKVGMPGKDIETGYSEYYICGSSDPNRPLWLNGKRVENRSVKGYFGILISLEEGENIFTFTQSGASASIVITKPFKSYAAIKLDVPDIPHDSVFPQKEELKMPGEKITLSCKAPVGAMVDVTIGGKTFSMSPASTEPIKEGILFTTFSYIYTIPSYGGNPRNINIGMPVYKMNYKGTIKTVKAPSKIGAIMKMSPYYAEVIKDGIYTYSQPNSGSGGIHELQKGMVDYVTGITGNYVRLSMGHWVDKSNVKIYSGKSRLNTIINKAEYMKENEWEKLCLYTNTPSLAIANYENNEIILTIAGLDKGILPKISKDGLVSAIEIKVGEYNGRYKISLKENISGYYLEKLPDGIVLNIRREIRAQEGDYPLRGITIMIDPGHGGDSLGAVGPLGEEFAEKDINLKCSIKLKNELEVMGAEVLMTRTEDNAVSLDERLKMSKAAKPNLFISIHANSMESNVDISKVAGFSIFYRDAYAYKISKEIHDSIVKDLGRNDKGIHKQKFYVFRGTWSPSVLLESGFVPNPIEFDWLTDEEAQDILVKNYAEAILKYYTDL